MKDLNKLASQCEADLRSIGICPGTVRKWIINTRAKDRWGQCARVSPGVFEIEISHRLLQDTVSDQVAMDTIMHELLHTLEGCFSHVGRWKELAKLVNRSLPQYNVRRTDSNEDLGLPDEPLRYALKCLNCGREVQRDRMCPVIRCPEQYHCGECGGPLERIR